MIQAKDIPVEVVLQACRAFHAYETPETPDEALPYPPKVTLAKMEKLCRAGLIDYGVSLRTAWLTDAGRALLDQ
jgi:hypothetical protein